MIKSGNYIPDSSWALASNGRGMIAKRAELVWIACTMADPAAVQPALVEEIFFGQDYDVYSQQFEATSWELGAAYVDNITMFSRTLAQHQTLARSQGNRILSALGSFEVGLDASVRSSVRPSSSPSTTVSNEIPTLPPHLSPALNGSGAEGLV